ACDAVPPCGPKQANTRSRLCHCPNMPLIGGMSVFLGDPARFAAIHAVRRDPELKQFYRRKLIQKGLGKARAAVARKLAIRMWIMLRDQIEYNEFCRRRQMQQKSGDAWAGMPAARYGAKVTG